MSEAWVLALPPWPQHSGNPATEPALSVGVATPSSGEPLRKLFGPYLDGCPPRPEASSLFEGNELVSEA